MVTTALSSDGLILNVTGILDTQQVACLVDKADKFISSVEHPVFDLQGVTKAESIALALLTTWCRKSRRAGKVARFVHVPKHLMDLAKLSNVDNILCLSDQ